MTGGQILGMAAAVGGLVGVMWSRAERADCSARDLGLDPEHNRQIALGVVDLREHPEALDRILDRALPLPETPEVAS